MTSATTRSVAGPGEEAYPRAAGKQHLRPEGSGSAVTLAADEDLGRVDPDEANALPIAKPDRVAVADMIDAVDG
jgi:hypothetical protein